MKNILMQTQALCVRYGNVHAVQNLSFSLAEEEILAVIGPNGSGKTSAIECIEGLRRPSSGTIRVLGYDPHAQRRQLYARLGVQLQETEYPENIRVKELCALFSSFYDAPADYKLLLTRLGLAEKAGRTVKKLSGGEKQRLSILLALLPRPKLLILDELTTGLDPEIRHGIRECLKQIRLTGASILLVSHYLDEVEALADRILYLEEGRQMFTGTQQEFHGYVKSRVPAKAWREGLSLEQLYLLLSPKTDMLNLEDII